MMEWIKYTVLISCLAGSAQAQLGLNAEQCKKVWGTPHAGELDEAGNGQLGYNQKETGVILEFAAGVVWAAEYSKGEMTEPDIDSLLRLNGDGKTWLPWTAPGIPASEQTTSRWMCDDEVTMAFLEDGKFTIRGVRGIVLEQEESIASKDDVPTEVKPASENVTEKVKVVKQESAPKVAKPDAMPVLGDSKDKVIQMLGEPNGIIESNGKQIMIYGWGNIWISNGIVSSI